ncbi:MAG TPA: hypothetical protein VL728_19515 [Cyclobacteriaceae bacterium]|jgi:hypothetical protein|nr:hypothetical protein [Cyclobacteriaceae bacterium]
MAKINGQIQVASFEIIRDQIGAILADEINNQFSVLSNQPKLNAKVWVERFIDFDQDELPAINICLGNGKYDEMPQLQKQGNGVYHYQIQVYNKAKSNPDNADKDSMLNLQRLVGAIRSIIMNPVYVTLGFDAPFIANRQLTDFAIADPQNGKDTEMVVMAVSRLIVKAPEYYNLVAPVPLQDSATTVKLSDTDKGYFFEITS